MAFLGRLSGADKQNFMFPRRELPGKLLAIAAGALLMSERRSEVPVTPTKVQPEFKVGDLVAYDWEPEDDDAPESATDFGEIMGMRWVPEPDGYCCLAVINTWVYYVRWTHSTCPHVLSEPQYDGEPTYSSDLRLVQRVGGQE